MAIINLFEKLNDDYIKALFRTEKVPTDTVVFRLHYKLSSILIFFVHFVYLILAFSQSSYIACVFSSGTSSAGSQDDRNTFCFIEHTFTTADNMTEEEAEFTLRPKEVISEGLRPVELEKEHRKYHRYYFYTPFILMIQTFLFYVPRYIWYNYEGGRMRMLAEGLMGVSIDVDLDKRHEKKKMVAEYLHAGWGYQQFYALMFALCEVLNLASVSVQMMFLHYISGGRFSTVGFQWVWSILHGERPSVDLVLRGFPLNAHCEFIVFGPGGSPVNHSGFCTLALNMMSRRYFVGMWFYLSFLWICDVGTILSRFLTFIRPQIRLALLRRRACLATEKATKKIVQCARYGDWFLLYQYAKVVDAPAFADILSDLLKLMDEAKMK